jgi:hypothetical protein
MTKERKTELVNEWKSLDGNPDSSMLFFLFNPDALRIKQELLSARHNQMKGLKHGKNGMHLWGR